MRRTLLFLSVLFLMGSCGTKDGFGIPVFLSSYIVEYCDGPVSVGGRVWKGNFSVYLDLQQNAHQYYSPDVGGTGADAARFLEIAERNGDRSYNRMDTHVLYVGRVCTADNFSSVRVVCLKGDWDSTHPAGSSLNDVIRIDASTYAPYIRAGYVGLEQRVGVNKRLSDLQPDDLTLIVPVIRLDFDSYPSSGEYEFGITLVTTEGQEKTATCTYDFGK